jgi:small nuclear ribonucleoprotein (snRNP)-like protein
MEKGDGDAAGVPRPDPRPDERPPRADAGGQRRDRSKAIRKRAANQTLAVFLTALQGSACIVELDNETVIRGTLESVDDGMNLMMKACVSKDVYGRARESDSLHVRGGSVRYVHLAKGIEPAKAPKKVGYRATGGVHAAADGCQEGKGGVLDARCSMLDAR